MSIYITGDCHGDYRRFSTEIFPEQYTMGKSDYVIVCGDFGYWSEDREQLWWRKWLDKKPFTTLWVDGNHENYDLLASCPVKDKKGNEFESCGDGTQALRAMGSFIKGKENGGKKPIGKNKKSICRVGSRNGRTGHSSDNCDRRGGHSGSCRSSGRPDG